MSAPEDSAAAGLAARLAALTPDQRARLEERLRARRAPAAPAAIPPRPPGASVPLSYGQRRLWILQQWEADLAAYNMSFGIDLEGELHVDALTRSLTEIARRHEVLRTRFQPAPGEAVQVVLPPQPIRLAQADLSNRPEAEAEREAARLAAAADVTPFNLAQDPPWRALLVQLTPRRHRLLLTLHHIISDAWSMGILRHELSTLYAAFAAGRPSPLPELPIQYGDYACWQRSEAQVRALEPQLTYWLGQLRDLPDMEWPCDYPRPPALSFRGASENLRLDATATQALHELARAENATLFMVTLAAMQVLLARWSGQSEVVVGSPVAGRARSELEGLLGFFINMLVLRASTAGNPLFPEFLGRVRETALAAYAHQDLPFDHLVEVLRPRRDPGRSPLFDVAFVLQNAPAATLSLPGVTIQEVERFTGRTRYDLEVHLHDRGGCLDGCFVYNRDLFHPVTMQRLVRAYEALLGALAQDPRRRLADFPLLADAERREVLALGQPPARPFPAEAGVHEVFARQAAATPDAVALETGDTLMTYAELNRRADALAARLRAGGVERGAPVGVCAERSPAMVVAWLAALKAGGAYLPLDVAFPPERLAVLLHDAGARAVLVQQAHRALLAGEAQKLPCLTLEDEALYADAPAAPAPAAGGDAPAYVVFTSGSTGRPKGVAVPHRAVNRLVLNTDYVRLGPDDVVAQMSSCTFDAATFEVWGALLNGARLAFIEPDLVLSPTQLGPELRRRGVTTLFVSTALFHALVRHEPAVFAGVRQMLFGGEECDPRVVQAVLAGGGAPERLLHVYGPTETATFATWHPVAADPDARRRVPIGRPIANTTLYILDDNLALLPAGAVGEICIGGPGVALGYLGDTERTAQRFVPDPFAPDGRLYRSGDRGRWNADGHLEFLGRADQQVKIRGYRVEPGEIESALRSHPGVRDAAVCAVPGPAGDRCLAAYVVPRDGTLSPAGLSDWLRRSLPPYMLPAAYVLLPALPLSAHGKLDRRALPLPAFDAPSAANGMPADAGAARLLAVWREVLGLPGLGPADNFFDVGGHSLLGVNLMARIRTEFGVHLPLRALFDAPTVAAMAARLAAGGNAVGAEARALHPRLVRLQPGAPGHPALFIVPGGQGGEKEFTVYGRMIRPLGPDWPVYGLLAQTRSRQGMPRNMEALNEIMLGALRSVQPHGPYALVGECLGGLAAHALAARLRAEGETVRLLVLMDTTAPNPDRRVSRLWRLRWHTLLAALNLVETPFPDPQARHRRLWRNVARRGGRHIRQARLPARLAVMGAEAARLVRFGCGIWIPVIFRRYFQHDYPSILLSYRGRIYPGTLDLVVSADYNQPAAIDPWRRWADGGLRIHAIPGNHYTYVRDEADSLGRLLARLLANPASAAP